MWIRILIAAVIVSGFVVNVAQAADPPQIKLALSFKPIQADVEYDIPEGKAQEACKVTAARDGKSSGWLVVGAAGQTLRRFMDTDGDGNVDQYSYFRNGIEVYRDLDTNGNNKVDQSRWLNIGGARWGLDANEDGKIDSWKRISAEEVCKLAVKALITQDMAVMSPLLITKEDLRILGVKGDLETRILASVADPAAKLKKAAGSKLITAKTTFLRFDGANPGVVPADQWNTSSDITVYENAMAIIDPGNNKPGLVQIGEMVRVGDVWKLTGLPSAIDGEQIEVAFGLLVAPDGSDAVSGATIAAGGLSEEARVLVEKLQDLDKATPAPEASKREQARHNTRRADLLAQLRQATTGNAELREQWLRQEVDSVTAAVQLDPAPEGLTRLKAIEADARKESTNVSLTAYVVYRRMLGEHAVEMQRADSAEDRTKIHEKWLKLVEQYVDEFPEADETAEAALQLAIASEFGGKLDVAKKWYARIAKDFPKSTAAAKSDGALRRLDLTGKTLTLSGPGLQSGTIDIKQLRGRVVLVLFWTTWCKPCLEDLPELQKLYAEYRPRGFEVLGVNLDERKPQVVAYLNQYKVTWPQIHSPGSLESEPARNFGVISLPTMFLVDGTGKVVNRSISVADLKTYLAENLKK